MSQSQSSQPQPPPNGTRTRKFRFLFLGYGVMTVLLFVLVQRYMIQVARLYNYEIKSDLIQWTGYVTIFTLVTILAYEITRRLPLPLRPENHLRLTVLGAITLDTIVAFYQSGFGATPFAKLVKFVNYFGFGSLAVFAVVLWLTRQRFGLVEVIARPTPALVAEVERGHAGLHLADRPWDRAKRAAEILIVLGIILVSLPISILLVVAVWLQDPGPILVAKVAVKRGGGSFNQYKLRTMIKDAEGDTGPVPAAPSDKRVTRLGNLLRRTHIDELPQMLNILRGDMSLVGPRPERTVFVRRHLDAIGDYPRRHAVRPGLAGLAQVYGDYYSTPREKLHYDLLYIRRRSLGLDLWLFWSALVLAFVGLPPRRRGRAHQRHRRQEQRWRAAYAALRGERAPGAGGGDVGAGTAGSAGEDEAGGE